MSEDKQCGGSLLCSHGKKKRLCKECGGSSIFCLAKLARRTISARSVGVHRSHDKRKNNCNFLQGVRGVVLLQPWQEEESLQGVLWVVAVQPWQGETSVQRVWGVVAVQPWQAAVSVQGVRGVILLQPCHDGKRKNNCRGKECRGSSFCSHAFCSHARRKKCWGSSLCSYGRQR